MINRDSSTLWIGFGVALVGYLMTANGTPMEWTYMQWLQFASFILAWASGKLATSPLKGAEDTETVRRNNITGWALPLILSASLVSGCALGRATVDPTPDPATIEQVRTDAAKLATATKEAATLAVEARRAVQAGYDAGLVSRDVMQKVNDAAIVTRDKGLAFIAFAETVTTDPSLRVTATELLKVFDGFLESLASAGTSGAAIRTALAVIRAYLGVQ